MGINGRFLFVCAEREDVAARVPALVRRFFEQRGVALVDDAPLHDAARRNDPHLFGVAISPPIVWDTRVSIDRTPWVLVADTERSSRCELARWLAEELAAPVVLSSIYEICDPPEPALTTVFGAPPNERFEGLYNIAPLRYEDLSPPAQAGYGAPSFDPRGVVFLTFRAPSPLREASSGEPSALADDEPAF